MSKEQVNDSNEPALDELQISDGDLERADSVAQLDKKAAKKRAKKMLSADEKKRLKKRKILIGVGLFIVLITFLLALPATRWPILNAIGLRGTLNVQVSEKNSHTPLSDVYVMLDGSLRGVTNADGYLQLSNLRLGDHQIILEKPGYSREQQQVTVGLATTKKATSLEVIGVSITLSVKDWLNDQPVKGAKITSGKSKSTTDKKGVASIVIPPEESGVKAVVAVPGYVTRTIELDPSVKSRELTLVADSKNYFISKRDGKYDIYSSNLDGSNAKRLVEASGKEDEQIIQFTINSENNRAILVANREAKRINGRVVAGIYLVNLENSRLTKFDEGSDVQILNWVGKNIVYTKTNPELKYDHKKLTQLVSYNSQTGTETQIAQANYFAFADIIAGKVVYLPADGYRAIPDAYLTSVDIATNTKRSYLKDQDISYGSHTSYETIQLETLNSSYFEVDIAAGTSQPIDSRPSSHKAFAINSSANQTIWTERRDGKGALLLKNLNDGKERVVAKSSGFGAPLRFITNRLAVVRVATSQETADYVVDLVSGDFAKIIDVSNVNQAAMDGL